MLNARRQAEDYARALPASHGWPPFILVCDVGHVHRGLCRLLRPGKELHAVPRPPDRSASIWRTCAQAEVRERLMRIWTDPHVARSGAQGGAVTRDIAERLAAVSKALEARNYPPEEVAHVPDALPVHHVRRGCRAAAGGSFRELLERLRAGPGQVARRWWASSGRRWTAATSPCAIEARGASASTASSSRRARCCRSAARRSANLRQAAQYDWREVDPSIFGTLLEQALDAARTAAARRALHAARLCRAAGGRDDHRAAARGLGPRAGHGGDGRTRRPAIKDAVATSPGVPRHAVRTRVLDPACGTGNFLYVSLELMKRLEGEVLEALARSRRPGGVARAGRAHRRSAPVPRA